MVLAVLRVATPARLLNGRLLVGLIGIGRIVLVLSDTLDGERGAFERHAA
jgi:hypothetical protein